MKTELTREQKKTLRSLYGSYRRAIKDEDLDYAAEVLSKYKEQFPDLVKTDISALPKLIYSDNQLKFIKDMTKDSDYCYLLRFDYSGRGMYGDVCPAVNTSDNNLPTKAKLQKDSMGKGSVFYAQY